MTDRSPKPSHVGPEDPRTTPRAPRVDSRGTRAWIDRLLGAAGLDDPGCEAVFQVLDEYVDAVLRGDDVTVKYDQVVVHLQNCSACNEDTEGLLAAIREFGRPRPDL